MYQARRQSNTLPPPSPPPTASPTASSTPRRGARPVGFGAARIVPWPIGPPWLLPLRGALRLRLGVCLAPGQLLLSALPILRLPSPDGGDALGEGDLEALDRLMSVIEAREGPTRKLSPDRLLDGAQIHLFLG